MEMAACAGPSPHLPQKTQSEMSDLCGNSSVITGCGCDGTRFDKRLYSRKLPGNLGVRLR
jgi:hypothetical protein